jgi:D-alanine-D-alanine ligase
MAGWIRTGALAEQARGLIERFRVKAGGPQALAQSLSGGNLQKFIVGREIEVAVLGGTEPESSLPGEIVPGDEFYSYDDKYVTDGAQLLVPAPLSHDQLHTVQQLAIDAYRALRCEGMARVDFFFEENGRGFLCNEINTIPGFTPISMYPKLWDASGVGYAQLIEELVSLARERYARRPRTTSR